MRRTDEKNAFEHILGWILNAHKVNLPPWQVEISVFERKSEQKEQEKMLPNVLYEHLNSRTHDYKTTCKI